MGRRSRARNRAAAEPAPAKAARTPAPSRAAAERRGSPVKGARRTVSLYVGLAGLIAILVLTGIALLGGAFGPFIVVAYAVLGAGLLYWWAKGRLDGVVLTDEERMLHTVASGLLIMSVGFALLSALVVSIVQQ